MSKATTLVKTFWQLFSEQKWDLASELLHKDFVAMWPTLLLRQFFLEKI